MKKLISLLALASLTGCASPKWQTTRIDFNCIDYANAYTRGLVNEGYECGTADYTKSCGSPHRIVWLREGNEYIYVEPILKSKVNLTKAEKSTLRNHIKKGYLENDLFIGTKEIEQ